MLQGLKRIIASRNLQSLTKWMDWLGFSSLFLCVCIYSLMQNTTSFLYSHSVCGSFFVSLVRAVELFALGLEKLKTKMKTATTRKSSEILKSVAAEVHLQLQTVESQIQTDM